LDVAESIWAEVDGRVDTIYENIDYRGKLTSQNHEKRFKVLYPESGTNLTGCMIDMEAISEESELPIQAFLASSTIFYYDTDSEDEAHYLSAILNSNTINDNIKNLQSRGDFGARHIHKVPWEFPTPMYDDSDRDHRRLAQLGEECREKAESALSDAEKQYKATWKIREVVRDSLKEEIEEIDGIVDQLLQTEQKD